MILRVNQAVINPDEERLLLSTFKSRWSVTKVDNKPMQFNQDLRFGLILHNEETGTPIAKFHLNITAAGFHICN